MSLISEALRKAKQEAAERGTPSRGMVVRTTMTMPARRSAGGGWALLGVVAAAVCAGALAMWWLTGRSDRSTGAPSRSAAPGAAAGVPVQAAAHDAERTHAPADSSLTAASPGDAPPSTTAATGQRRRTSPIPAAASAAGLATAVPATAAAEPAAAPPPLRSPPADTSASSISNAPPAPATARGASPSPRAGRAERVFHLTADLGAVKLTIDYIAYRPGQAFAGINGERVVVGTVIDGILVEEIGADFIALRDAKGPFLLRLH